MSIFFPFWRGRAPLARRASAPAFAALCIAAGVIAPAHAQQMLTLTDAIAAAIEADPGLRASAAGIDAARGGLRQARTRPNPVLGLEVDNFNGSGELRGMEGAETTFTLSQELELGGQRSARIRAANMELRGAELDHLLRGLDLVRDVQGAFYEALAAQALVDIARERLETAEALSASVARRVNAARDPLMAGARADAALGEARIALARAEAAAIGARQNLANITGLPEGFNLRGEDFSLPAAEDHNHALAAEAPDMARALAERDRAAANFRLERSLSYANPDLTIGYRRFEDRNDEGALVAGVSVPLGVFNRNRGAVARARAEAQQAEFEAEARRRALAREYAALQRAVEAEVNAVRRIEEDVLPQSERALALARNGYDRGAFSYLDVLDAQRALSDARQSRVDALRDFYTHEAALDRLTARFAERVLGQEAFP